MAGGTGGGCGSGLKAAWSAYVAGGKLTVTSGNPIGNDATGGGGGAGGAGGRAGNFGNLAIFAGGNGGNGANGGPASGGGLYIAAGSVSISATSLSDNFAAGGAGGTGGEGGEGMSQGLCFARKRQNRKVKAELA